MNILLEDLKPIVSDLRNIHMKDSNTASDIDYQSMVKNIIDDFTSPSQIATEDTPEASNDAYINGLLLLFCKNLEMKITQLSVEEKQTLKEIFSRSKPAKESECGLEPALSPSIFFPLYSASSCAAVPADAYSLGSSSISSVNFKHGGQLIHDSDLLGPNFE